MKIIINESQLRYLSESVKNETDMDERARTLAITRKKRLFPKSAMMANPDRFKHHDKVQKGIEEDSERHDYVKWDDHAKWVDKFNEGGKTITCPNCKSRFTQTTYKKKKSLPICPKCGTHVQQKKED